MTHAFESAEEGDERRRARGPEREWQQHAFANYVERRTKGGRELPVSAEERDAAELNVANDCSSRFTAGEEWRGLAGDEVRQRVLEVRKVQLTDGSDRFFVLAEFHDHRHSFAGACGAVTEHPRGAVFACFDYGVRDKDTSFVTYHFTRDAARIELEVLDAEMGDGAPDGGGTAIAGTGSVQYQRILAALESRFGDDVQRSSLIFSLTEAGELRRQFEIELSPAKRVLGSIQWQEEDARLWISFQNPAPALPALPGAPSQALGVSILAAPRERGECERRDLWTAVSRIRTAGSPRGRAPFATPRPSAARAKPVAVNSEFVAATMQQLQDELAVANHPILARRNEVNGIR